MYNQTELLEDRLRALNFQKVSVVRRLYGNQSDSWSGTLEVMNTTAGVMFHTFGNVATMFTASDVLRLDQDAECNPVIRLKGPNDYAKEN